MFWFVKHSGKQIQVDKKLQVNIQGIMICPQRHSLVVQKKSDDSSKHACFQTSKHLHHVK